jgi:predicted dinucleotide-binding enzyme
MLGIVGAGKLGTTIARAAIEAGYDVAISGSGEVDAIALTVDVLAPGARAATTDEVVRCADIVVLAVPTHRFRELRPDLFAGKILVDAMNYWQPVDGLDSELTAATAGTSTVVQERFPSARVVKSLNQLGYHEFDELRRSTGAPERVAIGVAARTAWRCVRSWGSSIGSGSTPSMSGRSRTAACSSPTARPSPSPTAPRNCRSSSPHGRRLRTAASHRGPGCPRPDRTPGRRVPARARRSSRAAGHGGLAPTAR